MTHSNMPPNSYVTQGTRFLRVLTLLLISSANLTPVSAQRLSSTPSCDPCRVQGRVMTVLQSGNRGILPGLPLRIAEDSQKRLWAFFHASPPLVFDSTGRFLRAAGAEGDGPGEFRYPQNVISVPGDSVLVFDAIGRGTILTSDLSVGRTIALPGRIVWGAAIVEWPDRVLLNAALPTAESVGWPLHLVSMGRDQMEVLRSFGANDGKQLPHPGEHRKLRVFMTNWTNEGIWTAETVRYRLTEWSKAGVKRAQLERVPTWFATPSDLLIGGPNLPPSPRIAGLSSAGGTRLWVFTLTAAPRYSEAWSRMRVNANGPLTEVSLGDIDVQLLYRTRIEVIEPSSRSVIAVADWHEMAVSVLTGNRIATYTEDSSGNPVVKIVSFWLH
jgi:hypothetical protein